MARPSFRDRFFTPPVARAVTSPSGILLAGGAAAVAIVAGVPVFAAVPLGAAAWGAKVLLAVPRGGATERIDPFTVKEPWRQFVIDAVGTRNRFDEVVHRLRPGPLRDRLHEVAARIHTGAEESYRIAKRGHALDRARRGIDVASIERQRSNLVGADPDDPVTAELRSSLDAQQSAIDRLDHVIAEAQDRLRILDARMAEALARAVEISAQSAPESSLSTLDSDVANLVTEMESLRQALDETHGTPGGLSASGGLA